MQFIAKRKLHDIDLSFIEKIKKDMFFQIINTIWEDNPELIDEYWVKQKYTINNNNEIELIISIYKYK